MRSDLEQEATVLWLPPAAAGFQGASTKRHFDSLSEAIRFVMEELPADDRPNAWIKPAGGGDDLKIKEIAELYPALPAEG